MIRNYLKIAIRSLLKNRTFSIINIVGLSFSVAFCLLLFFYIRHEQSYDTFHAKKDRLYRLEMSNRWASTHHKPTKSFFSFFVKGEDVENALEFPLIIAGDMQAQFPEIKSITRFQDQGDQLVKVGKEVFKQGHILFADDNFFSNFSFPIKKGSLKAALASPNNVVLSESVARKYFGNQEAIGKTIELVSDTVRLFTVSAIAEDAPANSSIQYGLVIPLIADPDYKQNISQRFNQSSHMYVVELSNAASVEQFENKMNVWVKKYYTEPYVAEYGKHIKDYDFSYYRWYLRPITDCHYNASSPWGHYTSSKNIYQLVCLVMVILIIASLNYILLVISNAASRSQEVGVRKVMGANRRAIILQFWAETQIVVIISVIFGLVLMRVLLQLFNEMMNTQLQFHDISFRGIAVALISLSLMLGVLAGYYPAWMLSKMKPASILKSFQTFKVKPGFSRLLVILQYTSCVVMMISAFVINRQMNYINNKDLGFDKEQVLMVKNPTYDGGFTKRVHRLLIDFAKSQPDILQFSGMNGSWDGSYTTNGFILNGEQKWRRQLTVDYNYFEMLDLKFLQGRPFSTAFPSDTIRKVNPAIINETLFNMLGKTAKLGEYNETLNATIIGILKDYHFENLSKKIEPEELLLSHGYIGSFLFKIKAGQVQPTIAKIEKEWKSITNNYPFEYTFLDQTITKMYEADMRWQKIIQASCFFAIFIACMGLFGLSAINAINRTKEIGIRKVLGASVKDMVATLSSGFFIMVAISILIATPIAWWIMNKWLEDFAYRINITWWMFVIVGAGAMFIAIATVSFQAIKAAMANPVESLRSE